MARQIENQKKEGTIGNLTFYKSGDGYYVRKRTSLDGKRIATAPQFENTRKLNAEFGHVAQMGKLVRRGLRELLAGVYDPTHVARLTKVLMQVKNLDPSSKRGQRSVPQGLKTPEGMAWLRGFDFNKEAVLQRVLLAQHDWDLKKQVLKVGPLTPKLEVCAPTGATHITLQAGILDVAWEQERTQLTLSAEEEVLLDGNRTTVRLRVPAALRLEEGNRLYLLHLRFYSETNGYLDELANGAYSALQVLEVE